MNGVMTTEAREAVRRLSHSDLSDFQWLDSGRTVRLGFTFAGYEGGEGRDVTVTLLGVEKMTYERVRGTGSVCFVTAARVEYGGEDGKAAHLLFVVEGEAALQVVCQEMRVVEEKPVTFATAPALARS